MNFSSSLMTGMGISLGGLELATDYLFANPDLYEPELTEIKTVISNKPLDSTIKKAKTVKPKISKESIISKFNIIQNKPSLITDEIIDDINIVKNSDDFDFSFDSEEDKSTEIITEIDNMDTGEASQLLEANLLMQRLAEFNDTESINNTDSDEDYDIDIEDEDTEFDIENEEESDIDSIEFEDDEDELDFEDNEDELDFDIEDDTEESIVESTKISELTTPNKTMSLLSDVNDSDDEDGFTLEDLDDIDNDETFIDDIDEETDDINSLEFEDDESEEEITTTDNTNMHSNTVNNSVTKAENQQSCKENEEIKQLKAQVASLNNEMQRLTRESASKNTSKLNELNSKKVDNGSLDALIEGNKPSISNTNVIGSKYDKYTVMTTEQLYKYVESFMIKLGVVKRPVDLVALNNEFGEKNIKKLINKSYLIKIGKGVTIGR